MNRTTRSFPGRPPGGGHFPTTWLAPLLVMAGTLVLASCSSDYKPDEARGEQMITIKLGAANPTAVQSFSPNPATVVVQTEIVWFNEDTEDHQITSVAGLFGATEPTKPGGQYRQLFTDAGTYRYYCTQPGHREEGVINVFP